MLIVGDGDLSFAASAAEHVDEAHNLTGTVFEREQQFKEKYGDSSENAGLVNMRTLKMYGCNLEFGVDATNINIFKDGEDGNRVKKKFDCIIFNFPYPFNLVKNNRNHLKIKQ
jgi:hypothetical protein